LLAEGALILTSSSTEPLESLPAKALSANPDYLQWSFGGVPGVSCVEAGSDLFEIQFRPSLERRPYNFRLEVLRACERLDQKRQGKTIALCYTAGIDSELIARCLAQMGIPFELYFLDIWGLNRAQFEQWSPALLKELGKKATVVSLSKEHFYTQLVAASFPVMGCEFPTYIALTYLFDQIPQEQVIVVGDGDLDRSAKLYGEIARRFPLAASHGSFIPFSSSRVAYHHWSKRHGREGEFYFFGSTPELMAAAFHDPAFERAYPHSSTRQLIFSHFPEIAERPKTTNWDNPIGIRENSWARARVKRLAKDMPGMHFWQGGIGTVADLDRIFI
jgi:hypothetical protein